MKSETLSSTKTETLQGGEAESVTRPRQTFFQRHEPMILGGGALAIALAVWEAIWSRTHWISPLFFSGPSAIAKQFRYLLLEGTLVADMKYSGKDFAIGFALALVAGVVIGVIIGWYRRIRLVADPFLNALYATPRLAMMPLIIIWFGIGMWSKVFIVFISAFFPILVNTVGGIRNMDADLLRAARAFCASYWVLERHTDRCFRPRLNNGIFGRKPIDPIRNTISAGRRTTSKRCSRPARRDSERKSV